MKLNIYFSFLPRVSNYENLFHYAFLFLLAFITLFTPQFIHEIPNTLTIILSFFYLIVITIACTQGYIGGLMVCFSSILIIDYFFLSPFYFFKINSVVGWAQLTLFLFLNSVVYLWIKNLRLPIFKKKKGDSFLSSKKEIAHILESVTGCFFILDKELRFMHINSGCSEYFSITRENILGKTIWAICPHWRHTKFEEQLLKARSKKIALRFDFFDSVSKKWFEIRLLSSKEQYSVHLHDITKQTMAELRQSAQYKITQILHISPSLGIALPNVLQAICELLNWEIGIFWKWDSSLKKLVCIKIWPQNPSQFLEFIHNTDCLLLEAGKDLPGQIWVEEKALWIEDITKKENFSRLDVAQKEGLHSGFGFPIRSSEKLLGVMEFYHSQIQEPDQKILKMFDSIGSQIGQFIERTEAADELKNAYDKMEKRIRDRTAELAQINQMLEEEINERKKLEKEVLEISEKEQRRMGARLHDELCQSLAGIIMMSRVLAKKMEKSALPHVKDLNKIVELLQELIGQARDISRGLYPVELQADALMFSLQELSLRTKSLWNISCQFKCPQPILIDDNNIATHLYLMAQEAVTNAAKHSLANNIEISIVQENNKIILSVIDDGDGYTHKPDNAKGIGLHIIKYRARMIDAELKMGPYNPHGTIFTCIVPIDTSNNNLNKIINF